jgi:DNA-binding LacI/PurR family transcriptional regulator
MADSGARYPGQTNRRATIDDVATAANVSVATVSRALRGLPNVADSTRARVLEAAESLNYRADPHASRLAAGRTMTVGMGVPMLGRWYFSRIVAAVEAALAMEGYDVLLFAMGTDEARHRVVSNWSELARRVDALILVDLVVSRKEVAELTRQATPVVTIGTRRDGLSSVVIDNLNGATVATDHLVGLGHRSIGLIGNQPLHTLSFPVPQARRAGYRAALRSAGIAHRPELEVPANFSMEAAAAATHRLLALASPPTAVFAMSDEMAFGVLMAARARGLRVPEDLAVIGFDDHELSAVVELSTVAQPVVQTGIVAARLALEGIRDGSGPQHVELPTALVARGTTASPAAVPTA